MTNTTAQINARRTKGTGLTEEMAKRAFDQLGTHYLAIIEIKSDSRGDDVSGKEHVNFVITDLEVVSETAVDHVRELQRALFMNRKLHSEDEQLPLGNTAGDEPTIEGVLKARAQFEPHTYVDTADAICDVCGQAAGAGLHQVLTDDDPDDEPDPDPEPEEPTDDDQEQPDPAAETTPDPWEYPATEGKPVETIKDPFVTT